MSLTMLMRLDCWRARPMEAVREKAFSEKAHQDELDRQAAAWAEAAVTKEAEVAEGRAEEAGWDPMASSPCWPLP
eukprot:scaffold924_cov18-Prasinocladus_malaysianus.AAC.2